MAADRSKRKRKKSGFWFLAKTAFVLLMALSFASQVPAQTQKTPETNRSGNSAVQEALKKLLEQLANRANKRPNQPDNRQTDPKQPDNRPNGPNTPGQTNKNTNTRPANTVNGNKNTSGSNNTAGNNSAVNSGAGPATNNATNNALPNTPNAPNNNVNAQTPGNSGNSNTNIAAPANINTNTNTNIGSGTIAGSDTSPPGQWPYMLILLIAALVTIGIFTFAGIRYALSRGGGPAPQTAAAITAPEINIGLRPDANPKLEVAGGDVPSLDTGISLKFKFDPGSHYISEG